MAQVCAATTTTQAQIRVQDHVDVGASSCSGMGVGAYLGYGKRSVGMGPRGGPSESSDMFGQIFEHFILKIQFPFTDFSCFRRDGRR